MTKVAVLYARVSVDDFAKGKKKKSKDEIEQEMSISIESQLAGGRALAKTQKLDLRYELVDDGISGHSGKERPAFSKLLTLVARGDVDVIICRSVDRVGRNDKDNSAIRIASKDKNVEWHQLDGSTVDASTAAGGLLIVVQQGIAEYQSTLKSESLKNVYAGMAARGEMQATKGTFGYRDDDRTKTVPEEAALIKAAYKAVEKGRTVGSILREWNDLGVPQRKGASRWEYAHLSAILRRARNAGLVRYQGEILQDDKGKNIVGKWEKIIEPDLWQRVQTILDTVSSNSTEHSNAPKWLSGGLARCAVCNSTMRTNTSTDNRVGTRYSTLRCDHNRGKSSDGSRHASGRTEELDKLIREEILKAFALGPTEIFPADEGVDISGLESALKSLLDKESEIGRQQDEDLISTGVARQRLLALKKKRLALLAEIQTARSASSSASMLAGLQHRMSPGKVSFDNYNELKAQLATRWEELHIEEQRRLVDQLLDIRIHPGRVDKYEITHKIVTHLNDKESAY